ncbi:hypothetical protein BGZ83_003111 [Gryganskiella cystojenkinii]|nr:hypothetical protein BGZ83_003111 [Gryganskiella cystojenkinii]
MSAVTSPVVIPPIGSPSPTVAPTQPPATSTAAPPPQVTTTTIDPNPPVSPDPGLPSTKTGGVRPPKTTTTRGGVPSGGPAGPSNSPGNGGNSDGGDKDSGDNKAPLGPIIGGVAGVLVLAFLVGVFFMRYKKKSRARKRRLEFLDHNGGGAGAGAITSGRPGASSPAPGAALASAAGGRRPDSLQGSRPSGPGNRPLEMAAVGGGAAVGAAALAHHNNNEGYEYPQGYQQPPYGGQYNDQYDQPGYDQYDPYYAQNHQQAGYYGDALQQQQQQEYYNDQYNQNQFAPPAPIGGAVAGGGYGTPAGTGSSPSMTHATLSPKSYPQPPPSTTGGQSSPRTPFQNAAVPVPSRSSFDKNAKVENNAYVGAHSAARNPQVMPQDEDKIKVPV